MILGRFDHEDEILSLLLAHIPEESLRRIYNFRLGDVLLEGNKSLAFLSSLRVLDLSYTSIKGKDLWAVLLGT